MILSSDEAFIKIGIISLIELGRVSIVFNSNGVGTFRAVR